jgi:uncharacterized protein YdhG (YjbR/CyaY superfamily)
LATKLQTVEGYIAGLEPHVAHIVERVRETVRTMAPDFEETIKYGMPQFRYAGTYLYVGAWKHHLGLYPIYPAEPALEALIAPYRNKTDTVRFFYKNPLPLDLIAAIARARIGAG